MGRIKKQKCFLKKLCKTIVALIIVAAILYGCEEEKVISGDLSIGNTVTFGSYANWINFAGTKQEKTVIEEPITWRVLDERNGHYLLISEYGLDCRSYDNEGGSDTTWENSSLRSWLNQEFYDDAFTEREKRKICTTRVKTNCYFSSNKYEGETTKDKVFLLSSLEFERYFQTEEEGKCLATDYTIHEGAYYEDDETCNWWLRGTSGGYVEAVDLNGYIYNDYFDIDDIAVRPALWVAP